MSNEKSELCKWPFGACIIRCGALAGIGEPGYAPRGWLIPLSWRRREGCRRPRGLWVQEAEGAARGSTQASGISPLSLLPPRLITERDHPRGPSWATATLGSACLSSQPGSCLPASSLHQHTPSDHQAMACSAYGPATSMLPQWYLNPLRTGPGPGLCCPPRCGQGCSLPRPLLKLEVPLLGSSGLPRPDGPALSHSNLTSILQVTSSSTPRPCTPPPLTLPGRLQGHPCCKDVAVLTSTPWTAACQAPLSFTASYSLLSFMPTELVMLSEDLGDCKLHSNK